MFEKNVGGLDRIVRGGLGTLLFVVAIGALLADRRSMALAAGVGSAGWLFNVVTARCGLNKLLGVDTCSHE